MKNLFSNSITTSLVLIITAALPLPSFAIYHGYSACTASDASVQVTMTERMNSEGLGFDGLRIKDKQSGLFENYAAGGDAGDYELLERSQQMHFEKGDETIAFTILAAEPLKNNTTSNECSMNVDTASTVKMTFDFPAGKSHTLSFKCVNEGFNPSMSPTCH